MAISENPSPPSQETPSGYPESPYVRFTSTKEGEKELFLMEEAVRGKISLENILNFSHEKELADRDEVHFKGPPFSSIANVDIPLLSRSELEKQERKNPYVFFQIYFSEFYNRLSGIFQYGIDSAVVAKNTVGNFSLTRLAHSYLTAFLMEIVLRKNKFDEDTITKGIMAGLFHDVATPFFGDIAMKVFPELSEETNFLAFISQHKNIHLLEKHFGVRPEELHQWILGKKWLGIVLDWCDKMAYTLADTDMLFYSDKLQGGILNYPPPEADMNQLQTILKKDPKIGDIALDMEIIPSEKGELSMVCTNPKRLAGILFLRAAGIMQQIVKNPSNHARDLYVGLVLKYLIQKGEITKESLVGFSREESDVQMLYPDLRIPLSPVVMVRTFFETAVFSTKQELLAEYHRRKNNVNFPIFLSYIPPFSPGTDILVRHHNKVQPLHTALPEESAEIERIANAESYTLHYPKEEFVSKYPDFFAFLQQESEKSNKLFLEQCDLT